ncbi:hypothetical protein [Halostella salina]|uniref:hypothetical protein n=1 Tax=Halostella salina TaxID=1547897 RepID=UPI000EF7BC43|nr:hypothetical protein [Halostella salina]
MGLLARVAAAVRSVFGGSADDGDANADDGGADADAAGPHPDDPDARSAETTDTPSGPATTDCSVCGTTFEADDDACPLCGTAPGADDGADAPGPETTATDGTATDDAADRLSDLRDE